MCTCNDSSNTTQARHTISPQQSWTQCMPDARMTRSITGTPYVHRCVAGSASIHMPWLATSMTHVHASKTICFWTMPQWHCHGLHAMQQLVKPAGWECMCCNTLATITQHALHMQLVEFKVRTSPNLDGPGAQANVDKNSHNLCRCTAHCMQCNVDSTKGPCILMDAIQVLSSGFEFQPADGYLSLAHAIADHEPSRRAAAVWQGILLRYCEACSISAGPQQREGPSLLNQVGQQDLLTHRCHG